LQLLKEDSAPESSESFEIIEDNAFARSLFNYPVPMLQDKEAKEEERQKEKRWACLHRLKKKG
jgi:hypothetical protein